MGLRRLTFACSTLLAVVTAGCGGSTTAKQPITVLAAASLTEVFNRTTPAFTAKEHVPVRFSFGPSSTLVTQIGEGAPVDVLVTADDVTMKRAVQAGDVAAPVVFARNELQIAVAPRNPHRIRGVADLARPDLIVVACQAEAPCGRLAANAFRRANANVRVRSFEPDVSAVLAKVRAGEADAGLVYVTSVRAANAEVDGVALGADLIETAPDVVAVATRSQHRGSAGAFVRHLLSPETQATLRLAGFAAP
jgi:molybdate transport system substrate-binding protein